MDSDKKVVIAGGTGFIGQYLLERFHREGFDVLIISRSADHISWTDDRGLKKLVPFLLIPKLNWS